MARIAVLVVMGITLTAVDGAESSAEAKFLKNGVRAGDRSAMTIRKRPPRGARKRIYRPDESRRGAGATARPATPRTELHAWFWKIHSASASAADPTRFKKTLATMEGRRAAGKTLTPTSSLSKIASAYKAEIATAARTHNVSEALLLAVITVESRGSVAAVSPKGAQGLMQLIPATAKRFGVTDAFDPAQNIAGGAAYLSWLLKAFGGDPLLALAGYNAGEGAVRKHKGVPPFAETRDYVVLVLDALTAAITMCAGPVATPRQRCTPRPTAG